MASRRTESRKLREPIPTVIGAGITEKWYFRHIKVLSGLKIDVKPKYFGSDIAYEMHKLVESVLSMGGKAICVFDMDTTQWDKTEKERKEHFMAEYRKNPDVILCDSMPSIEYWFLLHFEKTNRYFGTSEKVIDALKRYMPFEKSEKYLSQISWVEEIVNDKRDQKALKNADELGTSGKSYTNIPLALRSLQDISGTQGGTQMSRRRIGQK